MQGHGSDPWSGSKIPRAAEELSRLATARDSMHRNEKSLVTQQRPCMLQPRPKAAKQTNRQTCSDFIEVDKVVEGTRRYRKTG